MPCIPKGPAPASEATTDSQRASLAEGTWSLRRLAQYESAGEDRSVYHRVSCRPITVRAEADMELLSDVFTQGEEFLHHWAAGSYECSRCGSALFSSADKWRGPCVWPSFRRPSCTTAVDLIEVSGYNAYHADVCVQEAYCAGCDLFLGHGFEDGLAKGDEPALATGWRF